MPNPTGLLLGGLVLASIPLAANMPPITVAVTNSSDSLIQIVPIDDAHQAPAPLDQIGAKLPPGAFMLGNRTDSPIHVVVALWSYVDKSGNVEQKRFNCDGYLVVPPSVIVQAHDSALISPGGCMMREHFPHLVAGKSMFGGDLYASRNKAVSDTAGDLASVRITIDCVIFADGRIWGPDSRRYYKTVSAGYWAMQSVVEEVSAAIKAGQDMNSLLDKIRADTAGKGDQFSLRRYFCANTLRHSPNPKGTLENYSQQAALPEFRHVGETQ